MLNTVPLETAVTACNSDPKRGKVNFTEHDIAVVREDVSKAVRRVLGQFRECYIDTEKYRKVVAKA